MPGRCRGPFHRSRLRYDPSFRTEVGYCFDHGIPHSHYLGGPLKWSAEDRDKNVAYLIEKSLICSLCGTGAWEWEENFYAYAPIVTSCQGCEIKDASKDEAMSASSSIALVPAAEAVRLRAKPKRAPRRQQRGAT